MALATASLVMILIVVTMISCGKKDSPVIDNGGTDVVQKPTLAVLGMINISQVTTNSATIKVAITSTGGATITEAGATLNGSATKIPAVISGAELVISLGTLTPNSVYSVKAYAINSAGVSYTIETTFKTDAITPPNLLTGTIKDIDGNAYDTIRIGSQTWLVQNLNVKHYRDGSTIPVITDNTAWFNASADAMCYYNNDSNNGSTYGALYNQAAVVSTKGLAPAGWHIPTIAEWEQLSNYLGGIYVAGGHLKEAGTTHWLTPNTKADNSVGFTALPAGVRKETGVFSGLGEASFWWSTVVQRNAYCANTDSNLETTVNYDNRRGFSIRCVKDK